MLEELRPQDNAAHAGPKTLSKKKPQSFYSAMSEEEEPQRSSSTDAEAPGVVMFVNSISPPGMKPKKDV